MHSDARAPPGRKAAAGRRIEVTNPIKTHQVSVRLHPKVRASLEVEIVGA